MIKYIFDFNNSYCFETIKKRILELNLDINLLANENDGYSNRIFISCNELSIDNEQILFDIIYLIKNQQCLKEC